MFPYLYISKWARKGVAILILAAFLVNSFAPSLHAQAVMPQGDMVALSPAFHPPVLAGLKVYPKDPLRFDFILDNGDGGSVETRHASSLYNDTNRLIKYFLAALTIPEKDLWVNLSPYEKDRIIPDAFGQTGMGRDLLALDYLLKKMTASLMYPDGDIGKKFWAEVYKQAQEKYGLIDIPVDTFNKVWIVPAKAVVFEKGPAAYVVEAKLKVMLESDYVAQESNVVGADLVSAQERADTRSAPTNEMTKAIIRSIILPVLEKEVNEGQNFAQLRQVYQSLILAAWYKKKIKQSLLSKVYVDQNKVSGVNIDDPKEAEKIWGQYVETFKKGVFNFIREEKNPVTNEAIPRKYFSGGVQFGSEIDNAMMLTQDRAQLPVKTGQEIWQINIKPESADAAEKQGVSKDVDWTALQAWYEKELQPLTNKLTWKELPQETRELMATFPFEDFVGMARRPKYDAEKLLLTDLLRVARTFSLEELKAYWPYLVETVNMSTDWGTLVLEGLTAIHRIFKTGEELKAVRGILVDMIKKNETKAVYLIQGLTAAGHICNTQEDLRSVAEILINMLDEAGDNNWRAIEILLLIGHICHTQQDLKTVAVALIRMMDEAGEHEERVVKGLKEVSGGINSADDFQIVSTSLIEMMKTAREKAGFLFFYGLSAVKNQVKTLEKFKIWEKRLQSLVSVTMDSNAGQIFSLLKSSRILDLVSKKGGSAEKHFDFYLSLFKENPRFGWQIWEGLFEALAKGSLSVELAEEEQTMIRQFIHEANGFYAPLYRLYKDEGVQALAELRTMGHDLLKDEVSLHQVDEFIRRFDAKGYSGEGVMLAAVRMAVPASGASFVEKKEIAGLFQAYRQAGDRRGDVPEALRGKVFGGQDLDRIEWRLKEGAIFDDKGNVKEILSQLAYPDSGKSRERIEQDTQNDHESLVEALKVYLGDRSDVEARENALSAFLAWSRHSDFIKEKIDHIQLDHTGMQFLEQLFMDKDTLSVLLKQVLDEDDVKGFLFTKVMRPVLDPERFTIYLRNVWTKDLVPEVDRVKALRDAVRVWDKKDIRDKVMPLLQDEELERVVSQVISQEVVVAISNGRVIKDLFSESLNILGQEKDKFEQKVQEEKIRLRFRVVKGIGYGLWGLNAGVCVARDVELWKKKEFYLLAMIDEVTGQAVGFMELFETNIDGKKVLTVPGIQPSVEFLGQVKAEVIYPLIEEALRTLAKEAGYEAIYLPTSANILSNRSDFQKLVKKAGYEIITLSQKVNWNIKPDPFPFSEVYVVPLAVDAAMGQERLENKGGIDLTPQRMGLEVQSNGDDGVAFEIDLVLLEQMRGAQGFTPVIVGVRPLEDLAVFLGV